MPHGLRTRRGRVEAAGVTARRFLLIGNDRLRRRFAQGRTIFVVDTHRGDGKRFIVHADEKLSAFAELERQVLTVTFYLESIQ